MECNEFDGRFEFSLGARLSIPCQGEMGSSFTASKGVVEGHRVC